MTTIGGGIAVASLFFGFAYFGVKVVECLTKRGIGKDNARTEAIRHGLRSGELDTGDVMEILDTFERDRIYEPGED